ncbi:hypothetical protein MUN46_005440 [Mesosutterella sp. AGMB02718]|uniref:7(1) septoil knot domain-containing protein n=1 Tax=Mesosutterella faecium TaxID=2925194 RepID=A0ABT7ILZ2_9BURK|nr:hypothetical protein [Mesosutterella sp. AGMB02718]MDL2059374.1 hypothetical protein [Mesosutterella sp. AGMB02718]
MRFQSMAGAVVLGVLPLLFIFPDPAWAGGVSGDCSWNGIPLYGNVKVVNSFPDIKVRIVSSFPDLKVKEVDSFPDSCGKWRFVDSFPDFKVKFVDSFPDIEIKYVDSFPGLP